MNAELDAKHDEMKSKAIIVFFYTPLISISGNSLFHDKKKTLKAMQKISNILKIPF